MGDIDDRWFRTDPKSGEKIPTARHGKGLRYAARYRDPAGRQKSKSFPTVRDARAYLSKLETDKNRGSYVDHRAGRRKLSDFINGHYLPSQTGNVSSQHQIALRMRTHIIPQLGDYELRGITPSVAQAWIRSLTVSNNYKRTLVANFSAVLQAAVDDQLIATNPFAATSVKAPAKQQAKVVPWSTENVNDIRLALPDRYRELVSVAAGLGLRQGEALGLAVEDVDFLRGVVHVRRQVKLLGGIKFYSLPKRDKTRDVPLPETVSLRLAKHLETAPTSPIALPWSTPDGKPREAQLIFRTPLGAAINRQSFSDHTWATARKKAKIPAGRENGMHALRHYFASTVLAGGASIRDVADWLGHEDPGFTLRTYAHLMPGSSEKMQAAIDAAFGGTSENVIRIGV